MSSGNESLLRSLGSYRTIIWWIIIIVISTMLLITKDRKMTTKYKEKTTKDKEIYEKIRIMNYATIVLSLLIIYYEVFMR